MLPKIREEVAITIKQYKARITRVYKRRVNYQSLKPDDLVLISMEALKKHSRKSGPN